MITCLAPGCKVELSWAGRGRKPKWCDVHKKKRQRTQKAKRELREDRYRRGKSASRFEELWMTYYYVYDEKEGCTVLKSKPVRRDPAQVWNATGKNNNKIFNRSGVFHPTDRNGLPGIGHSVPTTNDYGDLRWSLTELQRLAEGRVERDENGLIPEDTDPRLIEARNWLKANPRWWRFESDDEGRPEGSPADEHLHFSKDIRETALVHGGAYSDVPDESTRLDRCSACHEKMTLLWAGEFCSEECMRDYVLAFGPDGV